MLEDRAADIEQSIEKKEASIQKQKKKLAESREKLQENPSWCSRIWLEWLCRHEENGIASKEDDIRDLNNELQDTELAILSQRRDNKIIEENEKLPFPKDIEVAQKDLDTFCVRPKANSGVGKLVSSAKQLRDSLEQSILSDASSTSKTKKPESDQKSSR